MRYIKFDETRALDLILAGRATIDLNPVDYFKTLAESDTFKKYVGGSPANIAVGLSRLGKKCGFIGRVSDDRFGDYVVDFFKNEGIDVSHIFRAENGEKLGLTFTEILSPTESSILMYRNDAADLSLDVSDIDAEYIRGAKAILVSGTALSRSPSREACFKAIELASLSDTKIVFDIDYRPYGWKNTDETAVCYSAAAEKADIILGSKTEFELTQKLIDPDMTDEKTADYWLGKKSEIVVIKHGKEGSNAYLKNGEGYSVKPFPVDKLKSFGGGDGYASAFLFGLFEGADMKDCLDLASASASILVGAHGCSLYMPSLSEIREFIKKSKEKYGEAVTKIK